MRCAFTSDQDNRASVGGGNRGGGACGAGSGASARVRILSPSSRPPKPQDLAARSRPTRETPSRALRTRAGPGYDRPRQCQQGDGAGTARDAVPGREERAQEGFHAAAVETAPTARRRVPGEAGHVEVRRERAVVALPVSPVRHDAAVLCESGMAVRREQQERRRARLEAGVWQQAPARRQLRVPDTSPELRKPGDSPEGFSFSSPQQRSRMGIRSIGSAALTARKEESARFHSDGTETATSPVLPCGEVQGTSRYGRRPGTSQFAAAAAPDAAGVPSEVLAAAQTRPQRQVRGLRQRAEAMAQSRGQAAVRRTRRPVPGARDGGGAGGAGAQVRAALGEDKPPSPERFERGPDPAVASSETPQRVRRVAFEARNRAAMEEKTARGGGLWARSLKRPGSARPQDKLGRAWAEAGEAGAVKPARGGRAAASRAHRESAVAGRGMEALLGPTGAGRPEWVTAYSSQCAGGPAEAAPGTPGRRPQRSHRRVFAQRLESSLQLV